MKEVVPISGPYHMVTFEEGNAMKCETADHKMDASDFVLHQLIHLIRGRVFVRRFVGHVGFFLNLSFFVHPALTLGKILGTWCKIIVSVPAQKHNFLEKNSSLL